MEKTLQDRLIDTFLPVEFWYLLARLEWILDFRLTNDQVRGLVRFFLPPPDAMVRKMRKGWAKFLSPALYSPTGRRRLRKKVIRLLEKEWDEAIRERDPVMFAAKESFAAFCASLEASGPPPNWDRIAELGNARDFEKAQRQKLANLAENPEVLDTLFPRWKVLDHRFQKGLAQQDYLEAAMKLLYEFCLTGGSEIEPTLTKKSAIWSIFGLDPDELEILPPDQRAKKVFDAVLSFYSNYDEFRAEELLRWLMHSHLPAAVSGLARDDRVDPLSTPIGDGLTLGDVLPDKTAEEKLDKIEDRIDDLLALEAALEDLPASQRKDSQLSIEADDKEVSLEELCAERNRSFPAANRNFQRALRRLESKRMS